MKLEGTNEPIYYAICQLKRSNSILDEKLTNRSGDATFSYYTYYQADSIIISFIGLKSIHHSTKKDKWNQYYFSMNLIDEYYRYFTGESWKYRDGKLINKKDNETFLLQLE